MKKFNLWEKYKSKYHGIVEYYGIGEKNGEKTLKFYSEAKHLMYHASPEDIKEHFGEEFEIDDEYISEKGKWCPCGCGDTKRNCDGLSLTGGYP